MDSGLAHLPYCHYRLQPLLDCLLRMETDDVVGYLRIGGKLPGGVASACALRARLAANLAESRSGKNPALVERVVQHRSLEVTPFLDVLVAHKNKIDCNLETPKLFTEAYELGAPTLELRLDHEQIKVTVRTSLSSGMGAEQNHPRIGRSHSKATTSFCDQILCNH